MVFPYGLHNTPPEFRESKGDQRKGIRVLCKEALLHEPRPDPAQRTQLAHTVSKLFLRQNPRDPADERG